MADSPADVFLGIDVGKTSHHACDLTTDDTKIYDKALAQDESALRSLFTDLKATYGRVLVIVDQPNTIGALPVAVARDCHVDVAYLPGLAMRKAADLYGGKAKTDRKDAFIIADTARCMPHTLRAVDHNDEMLSALKVLAGFDEDLAKDTTRARNRARGLLTQIHPPLEQVIDPKLAHPLILQLLAHYRGPSGLKKAGPTRVAKWLAARSRHDVSDLVDQIFTALDAQTVTVAGTKAAETVLPALAHHIQSLLEQRAAIAAEVEEMVADHPLAEVLMSMPGVGIKTAAKILLTVGDGSDFPDAAHLAAYAGIAPVSRISGSSIRGEHPARSGNKTLKNALFYSAFASLRSHRPSRQYYERKRAERKRHDAAVMCLARRRCNVIFAMLKNREYFREISPRHEQVAA